MLADPRSYSPAGLDTRRRFTVIAAATVLLSLTMIGASTTPAAAASGIDASFNAPGTGTVGIPVEFKDTSESSYNEECDLDLDWDFGDGQNGTGSKPKHSYGQAGSYVVTLRVSLSYDEFYSCDYCSECATYGQVDSFHTFAAGDPAANDVRFVYAAEVGCGEEEFFDCSTVSHTIQVNAPAPATSSPPTPPVSPVHNDSDNSDSDNSDSDNSDNTDNSDSDNSVIAGPVRPGGKPTPTPTPTPSPAEPTDQPTDKPAPPTEPINTRPASWITGPDAPGAGITLMILAAVIGAFGGLSTAGRKVALVADRDENTIQRHVAARDAEGWGDRSFTWRFPGHRLIDAASVVLPDRLFRFSPLVGRVTEDGSEFRAMFGTLWLATPLAGIALGLASATAAGGRALPPSVWLVVAGAVLATFDAFSGALAVVLFAGAALLGGLGGATGGPDTVHSALVILAMGFLWMAIPLIGSAIRPFRRLGDGSLRHRWDVTADGVIAALLCGWVAQKLTQAMDLFAGQKTGLPEHANIIALVVMAAVALRVTMEHFAVSAYPQRLQQVEGEDPPPPFLISVILGAFIRTAIFGFIGYAFIGSCWQLWLGVGLFLIPQLIDHIREAFPDVGVVRRILPRGVVEIFILVVACTLAARFAMSQGPDQFTGLRLAFLLIAVPPALLGVLRALAEDADESSSTTWPREFLGAVIVAVTAVLAARGWDY